MSSIRAGYILELAEQDTKTARDELQEHTQETASHIATLRASLKQTKHFNIPDDDHFLLTFLRHAKFSQRRARQVIESYAKNRVTDPYKQVYTNEASLSPGVLDIFKKGILYLLPSMSASTGRCIVWHAGKLDPKTSSNTDLLKATLVVCEVALLDPVTQIHGIQIIDDFTDVSLSQVALITPNFVRLTVTTLVNSFPGRYKGFHFYKGPGILNGCVTLGKTLMTKKQASRFQTHANPASLHEHVNPRILPEELGGTAGKSQDLADRWLLHVQQHLHYFDKFSSVTYDASKKGAGQEVDGTFRKINVD